MKKLLADGKTDLGSRAAGAVSARCHPQKLRGLGVEAAIRVIAGRVDCLGDAGAVRQFAAQALRPLGADVGVRRQAGDGICDLRKVITAVLGGAEPEIAVLGRSPAGPEFVERGEMIGGVGVSGASNEAFGRSFGGIGRGRLGRRVAEHPSCGESGRDEAGNGEEASARKKGGQ